MKKIAVAALLAALMPAAMCFPGMANADQNATTAQAPATTAKEPVSQDTLQTIKNNAQARLGVPVTDVQPSPIKGLYQVIIGDEVVYADPTGDYIIMGDMFHTPSRQNVTDAVRNELLKIDFNKDLPFEDAIKTVTGDGSRKIAIFSDPNCTFCKKLENNIKDLNNATVYTFLYPVITPGSKEAAANIWCATDRPATWKAQMVDGKAAPKRAADCDITVLDRNIALGQKLKVTGTPAIFFEDGTRAPGAVDLESLEKRMNEVAKK